MEEMDSLDARERWVMLEFLDSEGCQATQEGVVFLV